ncbi:restriction endonuclease subunit S [Mesorhizobium sp.]|uniref:restriction endonuclease subunit S n=1 Tax=Mesorhizobium sp. TaxID=1871066 RepID=UPI000FE374AB|nr:restriction endonuclease subunit S [Mesorhizobium sp.]RWQ14149.1 MAG: hypothetical protein EOR92_27360 [Mesorhizobium sp.]
MSEVPEGWSTAQLTDLGAPGEQTVLTGPFGANLGKEDFVASGVPIFTIGCLGIHGIARSKLLYVSPAKAAELATYRLHEGDFLFSRMASVGRVGFVPADLDGALFNYHLMRVRLDNDTILPRFFYHFVRGAEQVGTYLADVSRGATRDGINTKLLLDMPIWLPPLPEQRRIVAKIDSLTGKSRRARDQLDHIPRLVEKYKQAVLAAAFRGDLTREWRAAQPNGIAGTLIRMRAERDAARVRAGLRSKGRNRSVPSKVVDLVKLPRNWTWATFDDCSWDMTVGHVGPMKDRYVGEGIAFLRSLNVRANRVDLRKVVFIDQTFDDELKKSRLHPGDLVVVRTGEPGVAAVIPPELAEANCSDLVICRLISSANPHFAAYYMNSDYAKSVVAGFQVGVAQQHFNVGAMSEMPLPFAPIDEQVEIVRRIEIAFTWIKRLASEATSARKLIDRLDQAVLAKAFRGELVPQDPEDEPASVLLERIRAEGSAASKKKRLRARVTS